MRSRKNGGEKRINVALMTIDTLRADHMGCYGYFRDTTPNIDKFASEGVLFRDSYASAIATGPAYTSIITGKAAIKHKYTITPFKIPNARQMDDLIPTLAEVMLQNGYQTAAFDNLCSWRAHPKQFVRGYNYYVNPTPQPLGNLERVLAADFNKRMFQWLKGHHEEAPFFLFAHYWDPHTPYMQPEPYRTMFHHELGSRSDLEVKTAKAGYQYVQGWGSVDNMMEGETRFLRPYYDKNDEVVSIDLYDGAIRYLDHHIGQFFQVLKDMGIYDETLIIIVADHGEALGQHDSWGHGSIYDHTIYVPIIMRHPDMPSGKVVQGFVQHTDLFPTIVDMTDAREWPDFSYWGEEANDDISLDGYSLLNMASGGDKVRDRMYFEGGGYRGVRSGEWKLIARFAEAKKISSVELYNMADDPMELRDLSEKRTDLTTELTNDLINWVKEKLGPAGKDWAADLSVPWTCEIGKLPEK